MSKKSCDYNCIKDPTKKINNSKRSNLDVLKEFKDNLISEDEISTSKFLDNNYLIRDLVNGVNNSFQVSTEKKKESEEYSTLQFIDDLVKEVTKIAPIHMIATKGKDRGFIKFTVLSEVFFEKAPRFIKDIRGRIKYQNHRYYNPDYQFSIEVLNTLKKNLHNYFGDNDIGCDILIALYIDKNKSLKEYSHQQWHLFNPRLRYNYFRNIDTLQKAYWFGFLCAEVFLGYKSNENKFRLDLELSIKDIDILEKFHKVLELDTSIKIGYRILEYKGEIKRYKHGLISFQCKPMIMDLLRNGFDNIRNGIPPFFDNEKLFLAWLLGYFDGDGSETGYRLYSTNQDLLLTLKRKYNLSNDVIKERDEEIEIDDSLNFKKIVLRKAFYSLSLGAELFQKMMVNYNDSLLRKRKDFSGDPRPTFEIIKERIGHPQLLQSLVNQFPKYKLAKHFGIPQRTFIRVINKLADEWKVKFPPHSHWYKNK